MYDVFISHSSKDKKDYVYKLRDSLKDFGYDVWLDEDIILTGDNIFDEIEKGIRESLCILLILTPHFFASNWTSLEAGLALSKSTTQIIPVIVDIPISEITERFAFLATKKYIHIQNGDITTCVKDISSTINKLRERQRKAEPSGYIKKVLKKINNFDSPYTNKLGILITDYENLCKISVDTGVLHATKIAESIIDDLYIRSKQPEDSENITHEHMLNILLDKGSVGLNQGVFEYLKSLISMPNSLKTPLTNDKNKKMIVDLSLSSVLDWYLSYISVLLGKNKNNERIDTVWHDEITYKDFLDMHEIDKLVLRADLIASPEVAYSWYKYNNLSHIAVRSSRTQKIVGYFVLFPITDELYEEIKSGNFKDNDLDTKNVRCYDFPDFYKLYVACVCVHPDYRNTTAFHKLYNSVIEMMYDLASEKEIYFTDIITEASTPQGLRLCKIVGFKKLMDTNINTEIYGATLLPPSLRLRSNFGLKLIRFYQNKYNEFKELF